MSIRDVDLNLLVAFETIYSIGNISQSADRLNLSQPALSNALGRLRKQLDDRLFVRSGNGVVPTARAEEIIGPVRAALNALRDTIEGEPDFDPETSTASFRMIVADPLERIVMGGLLSDLSLETNLSFQLQPPQITNIEDGLMSGQTDLVIFLMPTRLSELKSQPLCPVDLVVLARNGHPRIDGAITLEQLEHENHVSLALAPGKLTNSAKLTVWQRLAHRQVCHVTKASSIAQLVAESDLIGFVPALYARQAAAMYGLQVMDSPVPISNQQFHMVWHKRTESAAAHVWLRSRILAIMQSAQEHSSPG